MSMSSKKYVAQRDVVSPIEPESPVAQQHQLERGEESIPMDNASMEAVRHQETYNNYEQTETYPIRVRRFDDYSQKDVGSKGAGARPILRATSLILCAVILATNIAEYSVVYTGSWRSSYFGGPDFLTGVPLAFITFVWELADFITVWVRGRGVHPIAHIVIELILGLGAVACAFFTGWSLYRSIYWYHRGKDVVSIGPESVQAAMLVVLVVTCLSLHGCAIRDNKARNKAVGLKSKAMDA